MDRLYTLLAFGYFPKELPPIFSTQKFAKYISPLADIDSYTEKKWQQSSPYMLQQKSHYRRKLDILCPQAMLRQAHLISSSYEELRLQLSDFPENCSRPVFDETKNPKRAVRPYAIGKTYTERKLALRTRFPLTLKLDIKNYYRSIYTHSIPWAIHGKEYAKSNTRRDNLGKHLDEAIRFGQDGQTIGIPTGPDTSFIISEILLCRIVNDLLAGNSLSRDQFVRYYDDFECGCESEEQAHKILAAFEHILRSFELEINPDKVAILSGLCEIESPWLYQLRDLQGKKELRAETLLEMVSFVTQIARQNTDAHVLRYFLRRMETTTVAQDAWDIYQKILLSLFQESSGNAKEVFDQLRYYEACELPINKQHFKEALDRKVNYQITRGVTSELSWAVYGYHVFNIAIDESLAKKILIYGDCPARVLITKLIFARNLEVKTEIDSLIQSWDENVLNSSDWLFAYEILVNKWHNECTSIKLPKNKKLFEFMRDSKISFLEDNKIKKVDLPQAFKEKKTKKALEDVEANQSDEEISEEDLEGASNLN